MSEAPQHYRAFTPDLEVRSGGDGRTVQGIAVPYEVEQRINAGLTEVFVRGAFNHQLRAAHRVPFTRNHLPHGGDLIGRTTALRDDAAGLIGEWRVSKTPKGDETLELIKDGVLSQLSIGFRETANGTRRRGNGTVEYTKTNLAEVAVVLEGAYGEGAVATGVRTVGGACPTCGHQEASAGEQSRAEQASALLLAIPTLPLLAMPDEVRSQSNLDNTPNGRKLWDYWLGEGAAKWVSSAHPYTALVTALRSAGVPEKSVNGLAANLYHAKFGTWPGDHGKG